MPIDRRFRKRVTYSDEGFNDYIRREHSVRKTRETPEEFEAAPLINPDWIDWKEGDMNFISNEIAQDSFVRGIGVMTIPGNIATGTNKAMPVLVVSRKCILYDIFSTLKAITSGNITFTLKVNGTTLTAWVANEVDTIEGTGIVNYDLFEDDVITIDVDGTFAGAQNATITLRIKQDAELIEESF